MGRASRTRSLLVLMNGVSVGIWRVLPSGQHEFVYADSWIAAVASRPISISMPVRIERYSGDIVRGFFDNLLPNSDEIRLRLRDKFSTISTEPFDLLTEIGRDCVGAIQLLPEGGDAGNVRQIIADPMSNRDIEILLAGIVMPGFGKTMAGSDEFRISLAGAQEKTALLFHNGQWMKPHGATPTTHILKLPLGRVGKYAFDMTASVENEWLCSRILIAYGMAIAPCVIGKFGKSKALVVERFDRKPSPDNSWIMRLPQEDMCQATGIPPGRKYESDGGPGIKAIMEILLGSSRAETDRQEFFRAQIAFWMLCAIDGHGKNFSLFIEQGGGYRMTPLYDVLSAYPVMGRGAKMLSPQNAKMAMAVWGRNRHYGWKNIEARHFIFSGGDCGLTHAICTSLIDEMIAKTASVIDSVAKELPRGFPEKVSVSIFAGLQSSAKRLHKMQQNSRE